LTPLVFSVNILITLTLFDRVAWSYGWPGTEQAQKIDQKPLEEALTHAHHPLHDCLKNSGSTTAVVVSSRWRRSVPGGRGGFLQLPLRIRGGADPADGAGAQRGWSGAKPPAGALRRLQYPGVGLQLLSRPDGWLAAVQNRPAPARVQREQRVVPAGSRPETRASIILNRASAKGFRPWPSLPGSSRGAASPVLTAVRVGPMT